MGVNYDGEIAPMPVYQFWYEYLVALFCLSQFLLLLFHVILVFRVRATNKLSYLFRTLFVVCLISTTTQSIHYFTPGHPSLHLLGATTLSVMVGIMAVCNMQILKTFTVMTTFLTDRKITKMQIVFICWAVFGFFLGCSFFFFLGRRGPDLLIQIQRLQYMLFIVACVFYDTCNNLFISYVILKHSAKPVDRNSPSVLTPKPPTQEVFHKKKATLLAYLAFMISYIWITILVWIYAYTFPLKTEPWQTSIRIIGNHLGLSYPVMMYYFFQILKKVQFQGSKTKHNQSDNQEKPKMLLEMKHQTEDLEPTRHIQS
jgi:hypothetical protein